MPFLLIPLLAITLGSFLSILLSNLEEAYLHPLIKKLIAKNRAESFLFNLPLLAISSLAIRASFLVPILGVIQFIVSVEEGSMKSFYELSYALVGLLALNRFLNRITRFYKR